MCHRETTKRLAQRAGGMTARREGNENAPRIIQPATPVATVKGKKKPKIFSCCWRERRRRVYSIKAEGVVTLRMPSLETLHGTVVGIQVRREYMGAISLGNKVEIILGSRMQGGKD